MREAEAYARHKNLKLAAGELGVSWQSLYATLRAAGVSVSGDKGRYGSDRDKFAARAERDFLRLVPAAIDRNAGTWQAQVDFLVGGLCVDVKASRPAARQSPKSSAMSWAFSLRRQAGKCDFFCCMCYSADEELRHVLLLPTEIVDGMQHLSIPCSGKSKWVDYEVQPHELAPFFAEMSAIKSAQAA